MGPEEIKAILAERPFHPVRIHVSDGASYEVWHPYMVLVLKRQLIVGLPKSRSDQVPERYATVNILHVTRIEPVNGKGTPRRRSA